MTQLAFDLIPAPPPAPRAWKVARQTCRGAWLHAEAIGLVNGRDEIVFRSLRYLWNRRQRSVTALQLARWLKVASPEWKTRERTWIVLNVRRALWHLRELGLADSRDPGPYEGAQLLWRHREQGSLPRP